VSGEASIFTNVLVIGHSLVEPVSSIFGTVVDVLSTFNSGNSRKFVPQDFITLTISQKTFFF
jgi:hypothetical protein